MHVALTDRISLEEFLAEPEEKPYREYLYGRILPKAMPKRNHSVMQAEIAGLLRDWKKAGAGGEVETEPRCILTTPAERHAQLPDVAWFSKKPQVDEKDNLLTPPDLAVEVLSPDDPYGRVQQKIRVYLEAGVRSVWVVDPAVRTVSICRRGQEPVLLEGSAMLDDLGFQVTLSELFAPLD